MLPKQEIVLRSQGAYFPEDIERGFDLGVMYDQQQDEVIERCLRLPVSAPGRTTILGSAIDRVHKALIFNANGDPSLSKTPYEDHAGNAEAAKAAREAAEEAVEVIRRLLAPDGSFPAYGAYLGVPQVIDCGPRMKPGGASLRLGSRFNGKPVINCGRRLDGAAQRSITLGSLIDDTTLILDLGERP